jgi:hypothetical protein
MRPRAWVFAAVQNVPHLFPAAESQGRNSGRQEGELVTHDTDVLMFTSMSIF